jgi:tRNA (guanine-N7-)-methyltransferase
MTLAWSTDWAALFGDPPVAPRPLVVEIGFGRGAFLLHLAKTNPDANVIGLEIANRCLDSAEGAIRRERLSNVRVIHSRAETALHHLFEPASIRAIHVNFPDPWFKPGHHHRRLMQRDTLDAIVSRLETGGEFYLATDITEYAELSAELLQTTPGLDSQFATAWVNAIPGRIVTKYERAAREAGRTCYYFAYRRNALPAPFVPVQRDFDMPHVVFSSPLTLDQIAERFEGSQHQHEQTRIHFMHVYRGRGALLFETHVAEATIDQRIALVVLERHGADTGNMEYTLQVSTLGHPRATAGVHRAVDLLGDWLLHLHPQARALIHKVGTS